MTMSKLRRRDDAFQVGGEDLKVPDVNGENSLRISPARRLQMQHIENRAAARANHLAGPHRLPLVTQPKANHLKPLYDVGINNLRRLSRG